MGQRNAKNMSIQSITLVLNGGLNYAQSRANIADNELTRATNMIYDPSTDQLITRPGTTCVTSSSLVYPILRGYYYVKDSVTSYHVCACHGKLYYLDGTAWTEIGNLNDTTTVPAFLTFNSKLLIADGGNAIRTWDGSTYSTISGSPKASALNVINGRVVANAVDEPDSVYLSAPYDAESADAWNTSNNAVGLKAGYGDLLAVNAFGVYGDDLIISKKGLNNKKMYRLNVANADTTEWHVASLSSSNASYSAHTIVPCWNNIFFVDNNGFKSVRGVTEYGDLQVDSVGRKINVLFSTGYTCDFLQYLTRYNALWFNIGERIFCYTERYDPQTEKNIPAFTDIAFQQGTITSCYEANGIVYLTGYNGYLYKIDESSDTDETPPSAAVAYTSVVRTKTLTFFTDGLLRKLEFYLRPKTIGTCNIYVCPTENAKLLLKTVSTPSEAIILYDAEEDLYDADEFLFDTGVSPWVETSRSRVRSYEMAFEAEITAGRVGVEWCKAEIAFLEGGE